MLATSLAGAKAGVNLFQDYSLYFLESKASALAIKSSKVSLFNKDL